MREEEMCCQLFTTLSVNAGVISRCSQPQQPSYSRSLTALLNKAKINCLQQKGMEYLFLTDMHSTFGV